MKIESKICVGNCLKFGKIPDKIVWKLNEKWIL